MKLSFKFGNKFSKERFSAGLDIGTSTIKLVELKFFKDTVELARFNLEPMQADLNSQIKRIAPSCAINISVSGAQTVIRYIDFLRMDKDELRQALRFEAQKYIPFAINEVNLGSYILKEDLPDNKMLILIAAVKKDFLSQRLRSIYTAGLKVNIVDIDSLALVNSFNFNYSKEGISKNKTVALLNIGASSSNLNILEEGIPVLSRDIQIAGNAITQKIADIFSLDFKSAEELKIKSAKDKPDKVFQAAEPVLSNLAQEVRVSFDYYESQSASTVTKIFLSGGGSRFAGLNEMFANLFGVEVEYWNPLRQINILSNLDTDKINSISSQLAVVIGLGLRA